MQKHRIYTNIGSDNKVTIELNQDFDLLEILSLKFTQQQVYTSFCSDYGVVCGRISVNNGLGVPNARVSIFVPLSSDDENDPVISSLYPYKQVNDKSESGYRYNLLPSRRQHGGHEPTGTFPDQTDILTREEVLEVFEKYYKYTVKTNSAGDFMIWGVPLGPQTIHVDVDLSDIGCFSLRPYDFIRQGLGGDSFKNKHSFKSSSDIDSLPQIISFDKTIEVYPFWGNKDLCEIGITRTDFDLSDLGVKIEPKAFLIGGTFTDTGKNSINKNCQPKVKMGRKCDLTTKTGTIEAIRFTTEKDDDGRPILEFLEINEDIPDDGSFVLPLPMNMEYVYTNEFGENEITNDPNKGIPTSACYRFRFSLNDSGNERVRKTASYLVPNIREFTNDPEKSYAFSTDYNDYPISGMTLMLNSDFGQYIPKDYFYRFSYNKVYTVSSFQNIYYKGETFSNDRYVGIKEISPAEEEDCSSDVLTPPSNFGIKNRTFPLLIADVLLFFEHLINILLLTFINTITIVFHEFAGVLDSIPVVKILSRPIRNFAYRIQSSGQRKLSLITYPECEECDTENFGSPNTDTIPLNLCKVGEMTIVGNVDKIEDRTTFTNETTLIIQHGLNDPYPNVTIVDSFGGAIPPSQISSITYDSNDQLTINFISPQSGEVTVTNANQRYGVRQVTSTNYTTYSSSPFCVSATTIVDTADFISRQYNDYYLRYVDVNGTAKIVEMIPNYDYFEIRNGSLVFIDTSRIFSSGVTFNVDIVDRDTNESGIIPSVTLESGCQLYDVPYDELLVSTYYTCTGGTRCPITGTLPVGTKVLSTNLRNRNEPLVSSYRGNVYDRKTDSGETEFSNGIFYFVPATQTNEKLWRILREYRRRKRVGKLFCGGIVNYSFIDNWLSGALYFFQFKGKKGKYCKDVVKYINDDEIYYYRSTQYNPSTNTWGSSKQHSRILGRPTTIVDLGPRDEFIKEICVDPKLNPNCSVVRTIGPTSAQNFGEILGLAINYRMDVSNNEFDINQFFDNGGFKFSNRIFDGDLLQLISINNEVGIEEFDLQNPRYYGYNYEKLDPDRVPQVFKPNGSYWGATPIVFGLDEDGQRVRLCLNEPTHINYDGINVEGRLTESAQEVPFFLWDKKGVGFGGVDEATSDDQSWDYSNVEVQPLQGMTYGYSISGSPNDSSDRYLLLPITYDFSGQTFTTTLTGETFDVLYDVISLTDDHLNYNTQYPGFVFLHVTSGTTETPITGTLYVRYGNAGNWWSTSWNTYTTDFILNKTEDYYNTKQILSTPFMFYFGLRPGKTGVDKFIDLFGPKNAFPTVE